MVRTLCQISMFVAVAAAAGNTPVAYPVAYDQAANFGSRFSSRSDTYPKTEPVATPNKYFSGDSPRDFSFAHVSAYDQPKYVDNEEAPETMTVPDEDFGSFVSNGRPKAKPWGLNNVAPDSFDLHKVPANRGEPLPRLKFKMNQQKTAAARRFAYFEHQQPYSQESYERKRFPDSYIVKEADHKYALPSFLQMSSAPLSESSCDELKWPVGKEGTICGQKKADCSQKNKQHDEAQKYCNGIGARLCTSAELAEKVACHTGCWFDKQFVWSSTTCGESQYFAVKCRSGNKKAITKCISIDNKSVMGGRCCADVLLDKPTAAPTGMPTTSPTPKPTSNPTAVPTVQPPVVSEDKTALVVVGQQSISFRGNYLTAAQTVEFSTDPPATSGDVVLPSGNVTALGGDGMSATVTLSRGLDESMQGRAIRISIYDLTTRQRSEETTISAPVVKPNDFVGRLYVTSVSSEADGVHGASTSNQFSPPPGQEHTPPPTPDPTPLPTRSPTPYYTPPPTDSPTAPPTPSTCHANPLEMNTNRWGKDIKTVGGLKTAEDCSSACCEDDKCDTWSFVAFGKKCYLKTGYPAPQDQRGTYSGTIARKGVAPPICTANRIDVNTDRPGSDFRTLTFSHQTQCASACCDNSRCDSWAFAHGQCYLKTGKPAKQSGKLGVFSGTISRDRGKKCADENGVCPCTGTVSYGAQDRWKVKESVEKEVKCTNGVFGDPLWGTVKACYCQAIIPLSN
mmetsp:Transcript_44168/g.86369  ORF Transcript_44168/g.86369 Transcript_44168/m.86369 type:complete len:736 (+) Transcript_44168:31-2238(+)|eukprot:CAMPEP_0175146640 /NCGR_PEP_ID=MMETSP0087-20121206/15493_1 /TAXON_ID=136419 /ORGANISM="Unknown Unknown, Strain D1" /LENGTH=735 /DNA_ID=CAMNT_0016431629 /DNA_START=37 /DNA_END=2244 /DNA_ORIENTATION=+